jgi:uncharacterized protein (UPF0276 family)
MISQSKNNIPYLGYGLGLRAKHYDYILERRPKIDWFEIITENYIDNHKGYWQFLADLRRDYKIVMHGVSLSIGSLDPLNFEYLAKVKKLADFLDVPWISDHLCYTGINGINTHDLLPVPYTKQMLSHISERAKIIQDYLARPFILENPSTYIEFQQRDFTEYEFLSELASRADIGFLLDVNNIYVSCYNHKYNAKDYIDSIDANRIYQIHLAGHTNKGDFVIDTHNDHVIDEVWDLYKYTIASKGKISTMIEWDENIPDFPVLEAEINKARVF